MTKIMDRVMQLAGAALVRADRSRLNESAFIATWDACLGALRDPAIMPDRRINELAALVWKLISSRTVCTVVMEKVKSVSFAVIGNTESCWTAIIALPEGWPALFAKDPWMQLGAVVYAASQARDFWNARLIGHADEANRRARAHEAILLRFAQRDKSARWPFSENAYQSEVLEDFGAGFPEELCYVSVAFDLDRAKKLFADFSKRGIVAPTGV